MDLLLDRNATNDLVFVNGECPVTPDFTESVAQKVFIMLRTFEGEWYLDADCGPPYLQRILGHKIEKKNVDRIIQEKILGVDGVGDIVAFYSEINERNYSALIKIRDTSSAVFSETINTAYLV